MANEANDKTGVEILSTGVKAAGEYLIPGGSNLVKGDLGQGILHAALGFAARAAFGLPGLIVVSMNSLTKSVSGRHIHEHLGLWQKGEQPASQQGKSEVPARTQGAN